MKNTAFALTKPLIDWITREAEIRGISRSEFVRGVLEAKMESGDEKAISERMRLIEVQMVEIRHLPVIKESLTTELPRNAR